MTKQIDIFGDKKTIIEVEIDSDGNIVRSSLPQQIEQDCGCIHDLYDVIEGKYTVYTKTYDNTCQTCRTRMAEVQAQKLADEQNLIRESLISLTAQRTAAQSLGYTEEVARLDAEISRLNSLLNS